MSWTSSWSSSRSTSFSTAPASAAVDIGTVFDGNIIKSSFERLEIAGRHVTSHLLKLLHQRGYAFNSTSDFEIVREIKEKFCFVSGDIAVHKKIALETCVHEK